MRQRRGGCTLQGQVWPQGIRSASYGARSFGSVAPRVRPSRVSTQLYLLDLQPAFVLEEVEPGHALALIVLTRREGLLLALPELALSLDVLEAGNAEGAQGLVGVCMRLEVACAVVDKKLGPVFHLWPRDVPWWLSW